MTPTEYAVLEEYANAVAIDIDGDTKIEVEACRRRQRDGSSLWCVKRLSSVLTRDGDWELEPQPSSRDEEFKARTRWRSLQEAMAAYYEHVAGD